MASFALAGAVSHIACSQPFAESTNCRDIFSLTVIANATARRPGFSALTCVPGSATKVHESHSELAKDSPCRRQGHGLLRHASSTTLPHYSGLERTSASGRKQGNLVMRDQAHGKGTKCPQTPTCVNDKRSDPRRMTRKVLLRSSRALAKGELDR